MIKRITTLAAAAAALSIGSAQAQVNLYFTGSTAFRSSVYASVRALYGANLTSQNPADPASSANRITWTGTIPNLFGAQTVTVRANYSGSVEGIQSLTANLDEVFFATATPGDATLVTNKADMALSDVFQSSTAFKSPVLQPNAANSPVGVVPFVFVKSAATPASVTSVGAAQAFTLFANGLTDLSQLSENIADQGNLIYLAGRNVGSGTRLAVELNMNFPPGAGKLYSTNGSSCTWVEFPGYSSGSGIVTLLSNNTCTAVGGQPVIAYLGLADAKNAAAGGAAVIGTDGEFPFTGSITAPGSFTPITLGLYNNWSYEHLYSKVNSGNVATFRNELKKAIGTNLLTSTTFVPLAAMQVQRQADGGPISP